MKYIKFGEKKNGRYLKAEELTIPQFKKIYVWNYIR